MEERKKTILIVEDDAGLIELIGERIRDFGYDTICISSAVDAQEWLRTNVPLLMVLDYNLPDMTAREFITALNNKEEYIPPFVLATGRGDERIAVEMMKLGARDYIVKDSFFLDMIPLVVSRVGVEIENEIKLKQAEQALIESNRFSRQIIDCALEGIVVCDKDLRVITWNPFIEQLLGYSEADVVGRSLLDFYPQLKAIGVIENLECALQGIIRPGVEFDYISAESEKPVCISVEVSTLRNALGDITGVICVVRDITERKNAESEVQRVSKHYQAIIEKSPDGFVLLNHEGHFRYFSRSALRMFGYTESDAFPVHPNELTHPDDLPMVLANLERIIADPAFIPVLEYRFKHKNGDWKWIESTFSNLYDDPAVESIVINFRDITERKMAELVLLESESRYHTLFNSSFEAILLTSPDGTILSANQAACTMFGLTEEELCRGGRESVVDFSDPGLATALEERARTGKFSGELMFIRSNGEKFPAEVSSSFFKDRDGNVRTSMIIRDITERKRSQADLQANRDMLNRLLHISSEFIDSGVETIDYKKTVDTILEISGARYASFNMFEEDGLNFTTVAMSGLDGIQQKAKSILGYDVINNKWKYDPVRADKLRGNVITRFDSFFDIVGSAIPRPVALIVENMFNLGEVYVVQIVKNNKAIGDFTLLFAKGNSIRNREIVELYANQVGLFIERLNSEKALGESEETYRNLVMRIPDGVYKSTKDGRFLDVNPAMVRMLGYESKEEIMDINILSELYFDISDREVNLLNNKKEEMSEFQLRKKDGSAIWIEDHGWYNADKDGNIVSHEGVLRDITERKLAEEALKASEDKYRTMIEYSNDLIWTVDVKGNFIFMNRVAQDTTGLVFEEWQGKSFDPLILPEDREQMNNVFERTLRGETCSYEMRFKKADETMLAIYVNSSPIYVSGKIEGVVSFGHDITDRKLAEQALEEKMNELIRFHDLTVDRELSMIELKKEVNGLLKENGGKEKYKIIE
jgi:PAS domain S-box-containing protein